MTRTPPSLLQRLRQAGDRSAWDHFAELYTPLLYRWARRCGLKADDAAELVQDTFIVLLRRLPQFEYDPAKSFRGWLKKVTVDVWRLRCRRLAGQAMPLDDVAEPAVADDVEEFWERDYQEHLVQRAFQLLRTDFAEVTWRACLLTVMEGRSAAEAAALLGLSEASVYQARSRVLRRLREELNELLG